MPFQRDEARWISFEVHPLQNDRSVVIRHESPVLEQRGVRNTSGITETRYVIREQLVLGEESWPIELTLTNRDPLDRMLAAQAELNRLVLLTADPQLSTFPCRTLW